MFHLLLSSLSSKIFEITIHKMMLGSRNCICLVTVVEFLLVRQRQTDHKKECNKDYSVNSIQLFYHFYLVLPALSVSTSLLKV